MNLRLHTTDLSPFGQRVKIALSFKGFLSSTELIDTFGGTDALGELAPMRQIPILEHESLTLPESQVIVDYLDDLYLTPPLFPQAPILRAQANLIARLVDLYVAPHVLTLIVGMRTQSEPDTIKPALTQLNRGLGFLETYLATGSHYAVGDTLTMADIAAAPFLFYVPLLTAWHDAPAFPATPICKTYLHNISKDEHIAKAFTEMESAYKARVDSLKSQENQ